ncbi:MAG: glycine--tRNA ligase subunit beta [Gammaproteobacteria bacterium]
MGEQRDLLAEIGTEELPPKSLRKLSEALAEGLVQGLDKSQVTHGETRVYATPRRLAVLIQGLAAAQPDRLTVKRGPAFHAAFDAQGRATGAALGFARSCGVPVEALKTLDNVQGRWLVHETIEPGRRTEALVPALLQQALQALPTPKRMRWGAGDTEFVRPVHWVVLLLGSSVIPAEVLGVRSGRATRGHRFHHPEPIELSDAGGYAAVLEREGRVLVDFSARAARIRGLVEQAAQAHGGVAAIEETLLESVTALTEWPSAVLGGFDSKYLSVPPEVVVATLRDHQQCFPVLNGDGGLLPYFIAVSNLESRNPDTVRHGNERVVEPRLADAAFFWDQDRRIRLADRRAALAGVVYQERLGSLLDKSARLEVLAAECARGIGADPALAGRAAQLAKCDLLTDLVGEFPDLQGVMGRYYALHDGEPAEVATALAEHYLPRHARDCLPRSPVGQALALADRLDTLVGVFGIGAVPSGERDPYGLRRAAIACLRILMEGALDLDLEALLRSAAAGYGSPGEIDPNDLMVMGVAQADASRRPIDLAPDVVATVFEFILERLRGYFAERGVSHDVFEAVLARWPTRPLDFQARVQAVSVFRALPEAAALAAANKRIANILRQSGRTDIDPLRQDLLQEPAERELAARLANLDGLVHDKTRAGDYAAALSLLAGLRDSVDRFFDQVLVNCEDPGLRDNRLALLHRLRTLFLEVADVSRLQT